MIGFALRSVYNPGLCIDAPSATAGTQLVAAPCSGGSGQAFLDIPQAYPFHEYELAGSGMCVVATASTSGPLALATCAYGQQDEQWIGPS